MQCIIFNNIRHLNLTSQFRQLSNTIKIVRNPPKMVQYYAQACEGIFKEYGISMFTEDITHWHKGFHDLFIYMAIEEDKDELISCVIGGMDEESATGDKLSTAGCFYTHPDYRGTGISKKVFSKCLSHTFPHNTGGHGLLVKKKDATSSDVYTNMGYGLYQPFVIHKAQIKVEDLCLEGEEKGLIVKNLNDMEWKAVVQYDSTVSVRQRGKFMKMRLEANDHTITKVIIDSKSGDIQGVCCFRLAKNGDLQAGPFYCDNEAAAYMALKSVLPTVQLGKESKLIFHYPNCNQLATRFFDRISNGKAVSKPYAQQQFNKKLIQHNWGKVYGVTDTTLSLV